MKHSRTLTWFARKGRALAGMALLALGATTATAALPTTKKVIGYVPSYRGNVGFVRYDKLTHINYAFLVVREDGTYTGEYDANLLPQVVSNAHAQGVKVLISVGGGANTNAMGRAICNTAYPNSAATLKANLLNFMATYQLDGIDLDWEYPQTAAEATAFTNFVTSIAADVHAQGKLLTAATVGANWVGQYYSDAAVAAFDYLNVMAYDVAGANHSSYQIAVDQLAYWAGRGVPASKLVLGVPFYGYPTPTFSWAAMAYKDILASDPTAYSKDVAAGYAYNGVPTMIQKTQLAMTNASGIMIWELSMDSTAGNHSLLDAIADTITGGPVTTYTINASAGSGGAISPSGAVSVVSGANQTFTITPASGYTVDTVIADGVSRGAVTSYTFTNVTAAHSISASFKLIPVNTYTITASAGSGGSISPSGTSTLSQGASQTYTITPASGYSIAAVTVDGASVGAVASYTFSNIAANHTISASFSAVPVSSNLALGKTATASSIETADFPASRVTDGNTGTRWASAYVDPSWITVDLGSAQTFNKVVLKWEAAYGRAYQLQTSSNNSTWSTIATQSAGSGGTETLSFAATTARYIRMYGTARGTQWGYSLFEFEVYNTGTVTQYTLTASAGSNGSISPSGAVKVNAGASQAFTITPASGYAVDQVLVDGVNQGAISSYTFSNVTAAHTITASFKVNPVTQYTLTASAGSNGSISPSGAVKVNAGASQAFVITPASGYTVDQVLVDGVNQGSLTSYTFANVTAAHTISATFKAISGGKATGVPGNPHLSHNNWTGESSYALHMTMWWGNNGSSWELYENGIKIHSASLVDNSPNQQDAEYTITGKANGTYTYTCKLINSFGTNTSGTVNVNVTKGGAGDTQAPSAPQGLQATTIGSTAVTLSWTASTDNVAVTAYDVTYGGTTLTVTQTTATVSNLTPNTSYTFSVKARDAAGNASSASASLPVITKPAQVDAQAPTVPQNLVSTGKSSTSIALAWSASTDNVGVTGYLVAWGSSTRTVTSASASITGLAASTAYTFTVKAQDAAGNLSGSSSALTVTTDPQGSIVEPAQMIFDDFSYASPDDAAFLANWKASDYSPAAPGLGSFSKNNVVFMNDPANGANTLMQIRFTTQGSRETTVQGEVEGQRRFLYGTYASRMKFYNQPIQGPAQVIGPDTGDHMVATFFTISPYYVPNTEYGELDFEYLPHAGWNGDGPRFTSSTMWNTTWKTRDVRITNANQQDCSGWHTFWMTVTPTAVKYYMDDQLLTTHTDTAYIPKTQMLIMYNLWLTGEQFAAGQNGTSRTWAEDVDWLYHAKDTTMTRTEIEDAIAYYRSRNIKKVDTMPAPILPPTN